MGQTNAVSRQVTVHNDLSLLELGSDSISIQFSSINLYADCNGNDVADSQDILGGSSDCQPNNIPDECEPDCDNDGVPDSCEIAACVGDLGCGDCNNNGVPDECELPSSCSAGICTVGCDADCNDSCTIDACDIAECTLGNPICDDCNLNGAPDECDDPVDLAAVCVNFIGECMDVDPDAWSCVENWDIPGDVFPDNVAEDNYSVTLQGTDASVVLDVPVGIDSLRAIEGASLELPSTGGDMSIIQPGGLLVVGNALNQSRVTQDSDRTLAVSGSAIVAENGFLAYEETAGDGSGSLSALQLDVLGASTAMTPGGKVSFGAGASVHVLGEARLRTSQGDKGSGTPPDFNTVDNAQVDVAGSFVIDGVATISYASSNPLSLDGDFVNAGAGDFEGHPYGALFDWYADGNAGVDFTRQVESNGDPIVREIEAASLDVGSEAGGLANNFAFGLLRLEPESVVRVVDHYDNQQDGLGQCDEVIYVNTLEIGENAVLITNGCKVYYNVLIGETDGHVIQLSQDLVQLAPPVSDINGDGVVDPLDLALVLDSLGPCEGCPTDLDSNGVVDSNDIDTVRSDWSNQ
jgi:hypothetical protein